MRTSSLALACSLVLLAGCSHHDSSSTASTSAPSDVPYGWDAKAMQAAQDADTGPKKTYTCEMSFGLTNPPQPSQPVTIPGLIERVDEGHAKVQASSPDLAITALKAGVSTATVRNCEPAVELRKVDASFPADKYASLELDPISTLGNYYAFAGGTIPYADEAQHYDPAYQQTGDTFKKHDLLPAFQAKVDQAVATAKANDGHVRISFQAQLGHYDFATHTFAFNLPFDDKTYLNPAFPSGGAASDVQVTFQDSPHFNTVTITEEAKARDIEDAVTKAGGFVDVNVDAQVVGTKVRQGTQRVLILAPIAVHVSSGNVMGPKSHLFNIQ